MVNPLGIFRGGIKPPHNKETEDMQTIVMPVPARVVIPMQQHIGAPLEPLVKKGDRVLVGQKIGDSKAFVSVPVHSSVSGQVTDVRPIVYSGGAEGLAVEIATDGLQEVHDSVKLPDFDDPETVLQTIRESGIVGLGGAGFPTSIKLKVPLGKNLDIFLINAAECEPYITSDYREMMENSEQIIEGILLIMKITGVDKAIIGVEDNKPMAVKRLTLLASKYKKIEVVSLRTRYPQGGEKQLIYSLTGRKVPAGGLPSDVGVLVHNVNTVSFIAKYAQTGMPLIKKRITVAGGAVVKQANVEVYVGTLLSDVFDFCAGFKEYPAKVIMGGPMMGVAQFTLDTPVLKQTNAVLAFTQQEAHIPAESNCIRCGSCIKVCPMNLTPLFINACVMNGRVEDAARYHVNDCIECGCCSFSCPASRNLVQSIRFAKSELRRLAALKKQVGGKSGS